MPTIDNTTLPQKVQDSYCSARKISDGFFYRLSSIVGKIISGNLDIAHFFTQQIFNDTSLGYFIGSSYSHASYFIISKKSIGQLKEYLRTAQSDMDAITPMRFCENETVNLILSAFAAKAKQSGILLTVDAKLPDSLPFSDTELCSLLSNALENAIFACEKIADSNKRIIRLRVYSKNNKLCIDIRNSYQTEPIFQQGLPVPKEQGHGFGTKSIVHIVEKHGGVFQFSVKDGWFIFQATA